MYLCGCVDSSIVFIVTKLLRLQEQVKTENDVMETIKMYDRMGDLCHSLKAHQMAISCYLKEVTFAEITVYNLLAGILKAETSLTFL